MGKRDFLRGSKYVASYCFQGFYYGNIIYFFNRLYAALYQNGEYKFGKHGPIRKRDGGQQWRCNCRQKNGSCHAKAEELPDGKIKLMVPHNHPPAPGPLLRDSIYLSAKEAGNIHLRTGTTILVEQECVKVHQEVTSCSSNRRAGLAGQLVNKNNCARAVNYSRQKKRPRQSKTMEDLLNLDYSAIPPDFEQSKV